MSDLSKHIPFDKDTVQSIIGEGLHTGFRKGTDAPEAHLLWKAISDSDEAWPDALAFLVDGLEQMGVVVSKEPTPVQGDDKDKKCDVCGFNSGMAMRQKHDPVRYFEWPYHAHLECGRSKGWGPR